MQDATTSRLVFAAAIALAIGVTIYLFDRQANVYFLPESLATTISLPPLFGTLGKHLPSALHVYAFILLTMACLPPGPLNTWLAGASWFSIECLFEIGQHPALQNHFVAWIPEWFNQVPVLEASADFFIRGSFDPLDIVAAAMGSLAAVFSICWLRGKSNAKL